MAGGRETRGAAGERDAVERSVALQERHFGKHRAGEGLNPRSLSVPAQFVDPPPAPGEWVEHESLASNARGGPLDEHARASRAERLEQFGRATLRLEVPMPALVEVLRQQVADDDQLAVLRQRPSRREDDAARSAQVQGLAREHQVDRAASRRRAAAFRAASLALPLAHQRLELPELRLVELAAHLGQEAGLSTSGRQTRKRGPSVLSTSLPWRV